MTGDDRGQPADAEAALVEGGALRPHRRDDRVDEFEQRSGRPFARGRELRCDLSRVLDDRQREWDSDLRRGQSHADAGQVPAHRVEQLVQQLVRELAVVAVRWSAEHRFAHLRDRPGSGKPTAPPGLSPPVGRRRRPGSQEVILGSPPRRWFGRRRAPQLRSRRVRGPCVRPGTTVSSSRRRDRTSRPASYLARPEFVAFGQQHGRAEPDRDADLHRSPCGGTKSAMSAVSACGWSLWDAWPAPRRSRRGPRAAAGRVRRGRGH